MLMLRGLYVDELGRMREGSLKGNRENAAFLGQILADRLKEGME